MPHATRPGDVLGDRYRLVDLLTENDGGRFWRAYDRVLERHVAIHVIRGDDDRAPALMEAARRSATVLDPRVLRVLDAECTEVECYVVNEWGWGASLDIVVAAGALSPRRAAHLVAEVADAVAVAHAADVGHGRLNPENVLVDRAGGVKIIGLCVDAALNGIDDLAADTQQRDLDDLAGLLYCALTTRWAGRSASNVPLAPRDHGEVLRPRQVRAGIPRPLDLLCDEVLHGGSSGRPGELREVVRSARGVADFLADFVGDPTGMPAALLAGTPDVLPEEEQVVLPPVPEMLPHEPEPEPESEPVVEDRPTEAGVPIFGEDDDVSWLERRTTPAPPPPPFEAPPERPLFAPEPADGATRRTPRPGGAGGSGGPGGRRKDDEYWPWDTGAGASTTSSAALAAVTDDEPLPGRTFLRLGIVLVVLFLLAVAVLFAVNRSGDGGADDSGTDEPTSGSVSPAATREVRAEPVTGVSAASFDPQGDPASENDEQAPLAVDGDPATSWSTQGYEDRLGPPPGLKLGVGLVLDLGGDTTVEQVALSFVGTPTTVSLYVTDGRPDSVDDLSPVAQGTADGPRLVLDTGEARGTHLVVWLTDLPLGDDGRFRGTVSEVVVRGGPA